MQKIIDISPLISEKSEVYTVPEAPKPVGPYPHARQEGGFIYVSGTDLIPELHKHNEAKKGIGQVIMFLVGIGLMLGLLVLE